MMYVLNLCTTGGAVGHPVAKGGVSISEERQQAELAWVTVLASLWETVLDFSNFIWAYVCCEECTQFPASAPSLLHHFVTLNCDRGCCTSDSLLALWERTSTEPGERGMHQPRNGPPWRTSGLYKGMWI
ncbi:chemokine-like protein TAFA-4 isoform X3 [Eptesicus fuscus]|uniref:chemokine-like protein TAFA-4 isoform X3 n=1 Tax=Eptesicus fuscus TaxID=29078 RepID=UPI002403EAF6|nr:chemokine-like protein TAFA-4 isoform X3 [Eptesicus fuscus]